MVVSTWRSNCSNTSRQSDPVLRQRLVQDFLEGGVIQRSRHRKLSLRPGIIHQHVDDAIAHFAHLIRVEL